MTQIDVAIKVRPCRAISRRPYWRFARKVADGRVLNWMLLSYLIIFNSCICFVYYTEIPTIFQFLCSAFN